MVLQVVTPAPASTVQPRRARLRAARLERLRLAAQDRRSARSAELHRIAEVLDQAGDLVEGGWVQHGWFTYRDDAGRARVVTAHELHRLAGRTVVGACLVGAVVHGGGGPAEARGQLVGRTLDLTWSVLRRGAGPDRRTPSPAERAVQVRDLTGWNDARGRRADEVVGLLATSATVARVEAGRLRAGV